MSNWKHADVFPIIAKTIEDLSASKEDYVTHDEIVEALLADPVAVEIVDRAHRAQPDHTQEWLAHNMVAWFSERISVGQSDWRERFERKKVDGKWAYRPRTEI